MDSRINELYLQLDFRASEEVSAEREQNLKRIAHEITTILNPPKPGKNENCTSTDTCKAECSDCLFNIDEK